ncbi:hypothetical protein E3N88_26158 [Mikania micrantha]|uniref:Uncharacterized protein n=1 Tax=Mikania micrantha TaxID=192012 RepID=A0A5N6N6S2_9ASTR|nr:hypothetical protein E3N88_26158 [Mikania micrantha]
MSFLAFDRVRLNALAAHLNDNPESQGNDWIISFLAYHKGGQSLKRRDVVVIVEGRQRSGRCQRKRRSSEKRLAIVEGGCRREIRVEEGYMNEG